MKANTKNIKSSNRIESKIAAHKEKKTAESRPILPQAVTLFFKNLGWRTVGVFFIVLSGALLAALGSYNPLDPTLNSASDAPVTNFLGAVGASTADLMMQTLGLASYGLALPPLFWGLKIIRLKWLPYFWANLGLVPVSVVLLALAASVVAPTPEFAVEAGYGGALGQVLYREIVELAGALFVDIAVPGWAYMGLFLIFGLPLYGASFAFKREEWRVGASFAARQILNVGAGLWSLVRGLTGMAFGGIARSASVRRDPVFVSEAENVIEDQLKGRSRWRQKPAGTKETEAEVQRAKVAPKAKTRRGSREETEKQPALPIFLDGDYQLPTLDLLAPPPPPSTIDKLTAEALEQNAAMLLGVLEDFGVKGDINDVRPGPVVTLYELEPARGTKSSRVISLADDIARSMSAVSARVAVVAGRNAIGIELPNAKRETVFLRELLASSNYEKSRSRLGIALGKDISGAPVVADLASMPHLLVAGTTGSGKSVGINTMILSLLYKHAPETLRLIMVDPKMLELSIYDGIPHLLTPVVTEPKKAVVALKWAVREMEDRYSKMSKLKVRNLAAFNKRVSEAKAKDEPLKRVMQTGYDKETGEPVLEEEILDFEPLPFIVIVIDEMADLMIVAGKEVEALVQRLAQMARAAGLHVIMATQRPSVDVITGTIKANFPTRISFQVTSKIDSRTILNEQGAEQLLGMGDMLYMAGGGRVTRVHGAFVDDKEVEEVVEHLRRQGAPDYVSAVVEEPEGGFDSPFIPGPSENANDGEQTLYDKAVDIVLRDRRASTSYIQRRLSIGYNKAATLVEEMEEQGVISAPNYKGQREILVPEREDELS